MTSYQVRASFGKLEFTGCEINHLHIGAKPIKKKKKFKIAFRSPRKNICVHIYTQINICVCFHTCPVHPDLSFLCPAPHTAPGTLQEHSEYYGMSSVGSTGCKDSFGDKSSKSEAILFSKRFKAVEADRRWLSTKDNAISQRPSGHTWRHFYCPAGEVLPESTGWKLGMLPNNLQSTEHISSLIRVRVQNTSSAEAETWGVRCH